MSAIAPRLELRQGQSLVMTQQLQQSIKLLQLSSQELAAFIEQELEKNPLLAIEDEEEPQSEKQDEEKAPELGEQEEEKIGENENTDNPTPEEWPDNNESEYDNVEGSYEPRIQSSGGGDTDSEGFESFTASEVTLRDHLLEQLQLEVSDPVKRIIGQHLIDLVDESGYIKEDTGGIATLLGCDEDQIESTFATLHSFDPPGVCARNLAECLSIQLRDKDRLDPAMELMLQHLDLMAKGDLSGLRKHCGVDEEDMKEMCAEIRALNPRPGSGFQHETVPAIEPDVFLKRGKNGGWQVELNMGVMPRVLINRRYYAQITAKTRDKQEKKFLSDQLAVASWLVKALDQRAHTILKVSTEIVAQQDAFFREGIKYLRPLTLKEVAATVGLHESTVSRVTTQKYIATARGTYELKYFFNASIQNASGGEDYSNKTVQHLIKELIDQEKPAAILSDDAIAGELQGRGIDIARRTVAKYREILRISPSSVRRREKKPAS
jgi:RNA polymerase sigma-54 factor